MYVHKRCKPSKAELDKEKTVHGYCEICHNQGTIYLVKGTEDSYRHKRQGVTYVVTSELGMTDLVEMPPEPELTEETEAVEEAVEEALDAILFDIGEVKKEPDIPPLEGVKLYDTEDVQALKDAVAEATETPVEAEKQDMIHAQELAKAAEEARKAKIEALEAELAELRPEEK